MSDILEKLLERILWEDPDRLFSMLEKTEDFEGLLVKLKELRMGRLIAIEGFPELSDPKVEQAVDFVFWLAYWMERSIREDIISIETTLGKPIEDINRLVDGMNFGAKIKFLEDNYIDKHEKDEYIEVLREIKELRNKLSHGQLDKLTYGGYHLSDPRGQIKLTVKIRNSARRNRN